LGIDLLKANLSVAFGDHGANEPEAAKALVAFLASSAAFNAIKQSGLEPCR